MPQVHKNALNKPGRFCLKLFAKGLPYSHATKQAGQPQVGIMPNMASKVEPYIEGLKNLAMLSCSSSVEHLMGVDVDLENEKAYIGNSTIINIKNNQG